eukprot:2528229-Pyramimonas_sp.AAC.1
MGPPSVKTHRTSNGTLRRLRKNIQQTRKAQGHPLRTDLGLGPIGENETTAHTQTFGGTFARILGSALRPSMARGGRQGRRQVRRRGSPAPTQEIRADLRKKTMFRICPAKRTSSTAKPTGRPQQCT